MLQKNYCRLCEVAEKESGAKKGFREEVAFKPSLMDEVGFEEQRIGGRGPVMSKKNRAV